MSDFTVRSDSVDVEQIMQQIRSRIREKRGADYTEADIQELANVKLEKFLDPRGLRSDLAKHFSRSRPKSSEPPKFEFGEDTLYETHRGLLRMIRRLLHPILKLFINPAPLVSALHVQADVNKEFHRRFREWEEADTERLFYELTHNLVLEVTRLGMEVHNLKMRVESLSSRMDFDERRARSLEGVVQYRPAVERRPAAVQTPSAPDNGPQRAPDRPPAMDSAGAPGLAPQVSGQPSAGQPAQNGEPRRRRRRRRRRPGHTLADSPLHNAGSGQDMASHDDADEGPSGPGDDSSGAEERSSDAAPHPDSSDQ